MSYGVAPLKRYEAEITTVNTGETQRVQLQAFNDDSAKSIIRANYPDPEIHKITKLEELMTVVKIIILPICPN